MTPEQLLRTTLAWLVSHPDLAGAVGALVVGSFESARRYWKTGSLALPMLPLHAVKQVLYQIRRVWFTISKPSSDDLATVDMSLATLRETVGQQSYELGWPLSYRYRGEDLNARRYYFDPDAEHPHRQLHIRAWRRDDGRSDTNAHDEPSAWHHPIAHVRSRYMRPATAWVTQRVTNPNGLDPRGFGADD
jgi:hypothetical protein